MSKPPHDRPVSVLHGLWLIIFAVDASLARRGWDHRLGALLFLVFFAALIFGELRGPREDRRSRFGDRES